jgi:DNA-binding XRE family transcriptional regulator
MHGLIVHRIRAEILHMTQQHLAKIMGVSRTTVARWEAQGCADSPSCRLLLLLAGLIPLLSSVEHKDPESLAISMLYANSGIQANINKKEGNG